MHVHTMTANYIICTIPPGIGKDFQVTVILTDGTYETSNLFSYNPPFIDDIELEAHDSTYVSETAGGLIAYLNGSDLVPVCISVCCPHSENIFLVWW